MNVTICAIPDGTLKHPQCSPRCTRLHGCITQARHKARVGRERPTVPGATWTCGQRVWFGISSGSIEEEKMSQQIAHSSPLTRDKAAKGMPAQVIGGVPEQVGRAVLAARAQVAPSIHFWRAFRKFIETFSCGPAIYFL